VRDGKREKGTLGEQAKQSIFNFIVLWEAMLKFELNDLKRIRGGRLWNCHWTWHQCCAVNIWGLQFSEN
jgi:hypothetical protein